jgi:acyl carrier protein
MSEIQLKFIEDILYGYTEMINNENLVLMITDDMNLYEKLPAILNYMETKYKDILNWGDQNIYRLNTMFERLNKNLLEKEKMYVLPTNNDERRKFIITLFTSKFNTFVDHGPQSISINECCSDNELTNKLILALNSQDINSFDESCVNRALSIKDIHITSKMTDEVVNYIVKSEYENDNSLPIDSFDMYNKIMILKNEFEIIELSQKSHLRYIEEIAIIFNQMERIEELVKDYNNGKSIDYILEDLKSEFYNLWKNERDFIWIAKDYPDVEKEFALLDEKYGNF